MRFELLGARSLELAAGELKQPLGPGVVVAGLGHRVIVI